MKQIKIVSCRRREEMKLNVVSTIVLIITNTVI